MTIPTSPPSNAKKISIIITSYNVEAFITETLDSICSQTLQDIEIIVVDDGSKDSSCEIISSYADSDERIIPLFLGKNSIGGVATAANAGLEIATGEYIAFADGDDLYEIDFLESLWLSVSEFLPDIAICNYDDFYNGSYEVTPPSDAGIWERLPKENFFILSPGNRKNILEMSPVPWRKIYKRSFIQKYKIRYPVVDRFFEDNPFHWNVVMLAESASLVRKTLCHHRMNRPGQTMTTGNPKAYEVLKHFPDIEKTSFYQNDADYRALLLRWLLNNICWVASINNKNTYGQLIAIAKDYVSVFNHTEISQWEKKELFRTRELLIIEAIKRNDKRSFRRALKGKRILFLKSAYYLAPYYGLFNALFASFMQKKKKFLLFKSISKGIESLKDDLRHIKRQSQQEQKIEDIITILQRRKTKI